MQPGNFLLVSPDAFDKVQELSIRWLFTKHDVVSESQLKKIINKDIRAKYNKQLGLDDAANEDKINKINKEKTASDEKNKIENNSQEKEYQSIDHLDASQNDLSKMKTDEDKNINSEANLNISKDQMVYFMSSKIFERE